MPCGDKMTHKVAEKTRLTEQSPTGNTNALQAITVGRQFQFLKPSSFSKRISENIEYYENQ